jgi:hypothetical protein
VARRELDARARSLQVNRCMGSPVK